MRTFAAMRICSDWPEWVVRQRLAWLSTDPDLGASGGNVTELVGYTGRVEGGDLRRQSPEP